MIRDIINAPALQEAIEEALSAIPPALRDYQPGLRAYLGKRIAIYAEWPTAVRIDLSDSSSRMATFGGSTEALALSFDPDRRCGESALEQGDPRQSIACFGRKRVRRIVRAIALDQTAPTLVQHRLLTLAA